jgi:hypothetical protein
VSDLLSRLDPKTTACSFLFGGDAHVAGRAGIWRGRIAYQRT